MKQDPALAMMMSLYATLGVFLLLASRNPSAHRSLIAFTAWSSFAHATVMPSSYQLGLWKQESFMVPGLLFGRELVSQCAFVEDRSDAV